MIIAPSKGFAFVHLEKCGGTSVEAALEPFLSWNDIVLGSTAFGEAIQPAFHERHGLRKHSTVSDIVMVIGVEAWMQLRSFAVVRNPREIAVSLYFFSHRLVLAALGQDPKVTLNDWVVNDSFPQAWPFSAGYVQDYCAALVDGSDFDGFVRRSVAAPRGYFQPQWDRLTLTGDADSECGVSRVIELSRLADNWAELVDWIGINTGEKSISLERLNHSDWSRSLGECFENPETDDLVRAQFHRDYEILGPRIGANW